jgi:hypothetical protein
MSTGASAASSTDKIREEILSRMKEKEKGKFKEATLEEAKEKLTPPWFTHTLKEPEGDGWVLLSTLIPNWQDRKGIKDVKVRVFKREDYSPEALARIPDINPAYRPNLKAISELAYAVDHTETPVLMTGPASMERWTQVPY